MRSAFLNDLLVSLTLGVLVGASVAVVYQDLTIAVPFIALGVVATPLVGAARTASPRFLLWLGGAVIVAGGAFVTYGWFFASDGVMNALGVLGGTALSALGVAITLVAALSHRSRNANRTSRSPLVAHDGAASGSMRPGNDARDPGRMRRYANFQAGLWSLVVVGVMAYCAWQISRAPVAAIVGIVLCVAALSLIVHARNKLFPH